MVRASTSASVDIGRGIVGLCVAAWLGLLLCAGCTLLLRPENNTFGDGGPPDAGHDGSPADGDADEDGDTDEDAGADADADGDVGSDADRADADASDASDGDVPPADADVDAPEPCPPPDEAVTLALFTFDGGSLSSTSDLHHWEPGTDDGCRSFEAGPRDCGDALFFGDCEGSWLTLWNRPEWGDIRSIDFWLLGRPSAAAVDTLGILSRDARRRETPGHLAIFADSDGRIYARVQTLTDTLLVCSFDRITADEWHHVEVRLGAPRVELWIDGVRQLGAGEYLSNTCNADPLADTPYTIAGNDEPWVLGAINWSSEPDLPGPVTYEARNVGIDHLRFRITR